MTKYFFLRFKMSEKWKKSKKKKFVIKFIFE